MHMDSQSGGRVFRFTNTLGRGLSGLENLT